MGEVFEVVDERLQRSLALKSLRSGLDGSFKARFLREAQVLARLNHANILPVFDFFEHEDGLFIVNPLVDGQTLDELLAANTSLSFEEMNRIASGVAAGLDYAHRQGVIHRDVKPSNIMLEKSGQVLLMDFGIAKAMDDASLYSTQAGTIVGTPTYMAPEMIQGRNVDPRADIYSLGVVVFEMLTGSSPWQHESLHALLLDKTLREASSVRDFRPDLPERIDKAVQKALALNPEQRFESATLFVQEAFSPAKAAAGAGGLIIGTPGASQGVKPEAAKFSLLRWFKDLLGSYAGAQAKASRGKPASDSAAGQQAQSRVPASAPAGEAPKPPPSKLDSRFSGEEQEFTPGSTMIMPALPAQVLRSDREPVPPPAGMGDSTLILKALNAGAPIQSEADGAVPPTASPYGDAGSSSEAHPPVSLTFTASSDAGFLGRSVPITKTPFKIGRAPDCDLAILTDSNLSREQCVIEWHDSAYYVRDSGSRNGTWLNGRLLDGSAVLFSGAVIRFSSSTAFTFVFNEASELPDLTGCLLENRYKLIEIIRSGSKSAIYRAEDTRLPRRLAIKLLSPTLATYRGYLEQFNREAEMAARLSHPHIAKVHDFGSSSIATKAGKTLTIRFVCMEYMDGGSLSARIANGQTQTPAEVAAWLGPISSALDYSHRNGIIHSGLKATSIVFDDEGKPYVTDFAIATHSNHGHSLFLGAPDFMAPEQWEGLLPTPATDQYSLAVLSYYALTGTRPYEEQQDPDRRKRNFARGAMPVHQEARLRGSSSVPEALSPVISRGMAVKPEDRFPGIVEFVLAFQYAMTASPSRRSLNPEVFFSYRRDVGAAWASLFSRELQRQDISVFVDTERRDNVVKFPAWIEKAIQDCDIFVCLLSPTTLDSAWVRQEVRFAWENGKPMIPILSEDFKHPSSETAIDPHIEALLMYQGVSLLDLKGIYLDATVAELVRMIRANAKSRGARA